MGSVKIAILGHGNVGGGTTAILQKNRTLIEEKIGKSFEVSYIMVSNLNKERRWPTCGGKLVTNFEEILADKEVSIVVEALGGIEPASSYMAQALTAGKHVVTANKAALAENYQYLTKLAAQNNVSILFEASVGGGIPALTSISNALSANEFTEVMGILNGTTNYIMSKMWDEGLNYEDVLRDAQEKGFAEADPTADVEGIDVANKLSILIALAFGEYIHPTSIPRKGISHITAADIEKAKTEGKKIKLIAHASFIDSRLMYEVKPMLINSSHPLFSVNNEFNAIYITGDSVGEVMFYGKGAGPLPTGSAVVGDIIAIAKSI